jgi:hypothetical protein
LDSALGTGAGAAERIAGDVETTLTTGWLVTGIGWTIGGSAGGVSSLTICRVVVGVLLVLLFALLALLTLLLVLGLSLALTTLAMLTVFLGLG